MNITREDLPGRQVALTIDLDPETINKALDHAYHQMVNQVNIPGYRPGRAPRYMVERYVGLDTLTERAVRNILPQALQEAIADQNLDAMDVGDFEIVSMDPVQVKIIVVQPPKIELGDYSGVRVEKEQTEITSDQVEQVLVELQREGAPWNEPAEPRPIKEGDMVYLDLEGFTNEGLLPEAQRENFPTIVGMARAGVPEVVSKALEGMSLGEEKDIAATLADDYPVEEMRGRDVTYHVTTRSMKEQQLPEMNDEFAKSLGGYETVEALREAVDKDLRQRVEESTSSNQVNTIISKIVEGAEVDVPDLLVKEELDGMLKSLEERLKQQRLTTRQYFSYNSTSENEWRERNRERAKERVVRTLVLQEFARREGIEVDEAEIESEISQMLAGFEGAEKEAAEAVLANKESRTDLEDRLFQRKIVDRMVGIAEGRIEASKPDQTEAAEGTDEAVTTEDGASEASAEDTTEDKGEVGGAGDASDMAEAGGAAEVLGTEGVDLQSPNETGEAEGGGTPSTAPGLGSSEGKS